MITGIILLQDISLAQGYTLYETIDYLLSESISTRYEVLEGYGLSDTEIALVEAELADIKARQGECL